MGIRPRCCCTTLLQPACNERERKRVRQREGKRKDQREDRGTGKREEKDEDGAHGKGTKRKRAGQQKESRGIRGAKSEDAGKKGRAQRRNRFFPVGPGRGVEPTDRSLPPRITYMQQHRHQHQQQQQQHQRRRRRRWPSIFFVVCRFNRLGLALGPGRKKDAGALARQKQPERRALGRISPIVKEEHDDNTTRRRAWVFSPRVKRRKRFAALRERPRGKDPLNLRFIDAPAFHRSPAPTFCYVYFSPVSFLARTFLVRGGFNLN